MPIASWSDIVDTADAPDDAAPQRASFSDIEAIMPPAAPPTPARRATFADIAEIMPPAPAFSPLEQDVIAASPASAGRTNDAQGFSLAPTQPIGTDVVLPKDVPRPPLRPGRMAGLADTVPRSTTTTPQDILGGALGAPVGALQALPAAAGEQLAHTSLPGHENEPQTLFGRAWQHLKMTAGGRGADVLPQAAVTQALVGNPAAASATPAPTSADLVAHGPSAMPVNPKAQELVRRGLGTAAKMLMDPSLVAIGAAPSSIAEALSVVFAEQGVEAAVHTATNPQASDVDVAESVINALLMALPVGAQALRQIRTRVGAIAEAARVTPEEAHAEVPNVVANETPTEPAAAPGNVPAPGAPVPETAVPPADVVTPPPNVAHVSDVVDVVDPGVVATEGVKPPPPVLEPDEQAVRDQTAPPPGTAHVSDVVEVVAPPADSLSQRYHDARRAALKAGEPPPTWAEFVKANAADATAVGEPQTAHTSDVVEVVEPPTQTSAEEAAPASEPVAPPAPPTKREPRGVRAPAVAWDDLTKQHQREVRRIMLEMEDFPMVGKLTQESKHGGQFEVLRGRRGGAPVYFDIVGGTPGRPTFGYSRADVAAKLRDFVENGKRSVVSDLAVDVAERRVAGARDLAESWHRDDAGDEPGAVRVTRRTTFDDAERAAVQRRAIAAVENDTEQLAQAYREKFGNVVSADNAKELFPDYATKAQRTANDLAVHRPASRLAQHIYDEALKQPVAAGHDPFVVLTAGGTGAGKTSSLDVIMKKIEDHAHVVYDSTLTDLDAARANIEAAKAAGHEVLVAFTDRELHEAFDATLRRAEEHGRPVTVNTHVATHLKAPEVFDALRKEYAGDPAVTLAVVRNSTAEGGRLLTADEWEPRRYNEGDVRARLSQTLEAERAGLGEPLYEAVRGAAKKPADAAGAEGNGGGSRHVQPDAQPGRHAEEAPEVGDTRSSGDRPLHIDEVTARRAGLPADLADSINLVGDERRWDDAVTTPGSVVRHVDGFTGRVIEGATDPVNGQGRDGRVLVEHEYEGRPAQRWYRALDLEPAASVVDTLDTGEKQPRLPGAADARQAGKADTSFRAPAQASGDDFNLETPLTDDQKAADARKAAGPSMFDDDGALSMPDRRKRADTSGALVPSPASRAVSLLQRGEKQMRPSEIVRDLTKSLDELPIRVGKFKQHALGIYKPKEQTIRLKVANDLDTLAHELGHHIHESLLGSELPPKSYRGELEALGLPTSRPSYSLKQKLAEGQAEFTRYYLSDPAAAQRLAPNYYKAFESGLESHPELAAVLARAQRQYTGHLSLDPVARGLAHLDFDGVDPHPKTDIVTRLQTAWVDDLYPMRAMVQDLADHQPIDYTKNGYILARLARGSSAKAAGFLEHGVRAADGTFIAPALAPALKPVKGQIREFAGYLAALRALELRNRSMETGMTRVEAQAIVDKFKSPTFDAARDAVYAYQDGLLVYATHSGTMSVDQLKAIKALNKAYVPFQRVIDDVGAAVSQGKGGIANRANPIKRIKGSGRDIVNPLESIVKNTHTLVAMVEQNRAMQALVEQAQNTTGGGRYLEAIPEKLVPTSFNLSVLEKEIRAHLADQGIDLEMSDGDMFDKLVTIFTPTQFRMGEKGVVSVLRRGERKWFQVNDQALYDAIATIGPKSSDLLVNMLMKPARLLRAGATTSIGFIARNPIRDNFEAYVNSRYGFKPGYDFVRGVFELYHKGEDYQAFLNSGAGNSAMVGLDRNRLRQELVNMGAVKRRAFADSVILNPVNLLQALSEAMEHATRIGEFKRGVEAEGRTAEGYARAAMAARDVTIDFARGGAVSKEVNRFTAFFNAAVQGNVRLAEVFRQDPRGATGRAIIAITMPTLALWAINHDDEAYHELPDWERNTYWHLPSSLGAGHGWFRLPKPFSLGQVFANVPEAALDYLRKKDPEALKRVLPDKQTAWKQAVAVLPTALMPAVEVATNYDTFRDRSIVNAGDVNLDTALQYNRWTSDLAKFVGPKIGIAPAKLDHLIYGYGAGVGAGAAQFVDKGAAALGLVKNQKPAGGLGRAPLVGTFYRETPGADARSLEQFYRLRDRVEGAVGSVRRYEKADDEAAAAARKQQAQTDFAPDAGKTLERVRATDKALATLRDQVNQVFANPRLEPDEKKELLDRLYEQMVNGARAGLGLSALPSRFPKAAAPALLQKLQRPKPSAPGARPAAVESRPSALPPARPASSTTAR